ncbi:F-box/RNI-like/FBD-like domains-containing protein [Striga asiatica]|uniref:F-box/RNI-like/FBD-like domains-containing protein n=1 Tax=Striga asiatica TaxID=4170 RepID=A0A5A7QTG0_STRAF|nr:F-box/RNI-like/FBD-like domains-containing protein [Striga asiatica]
MGSVHSKVRKHCLRRRLFRILFFHSASSRRGMKIIQVTKCKDRMSSAVNAADACCASCLSRRKCCRFRLCGLVRFSLPIIMCPWEETHLLLLRWDDENMLCRCFHFRKKVLARSEGTKA